jgi:hypothetical protein
MLKDSPAYSKWLYIKKFYNLIFLLIYIYIYKYLKFSFFKLYTYNNV